MRRGEMHMGDLFMSIGLETTSHRTKPHLHLASAFTGKRVRMAVIPASNGSAVGTEVLIGSDGNTTRWCTRSFRHDICCRVEVLHLYSNIVQLTLR